MNNALKILKASVVLAMVMSGCGRSVESAVGKSEDKEHRLVVDTARSHMLWEIPNKLSRLARHALTVVRKRTKGRGSKVRFDPLFSTAISISTYC